MSDGTAVGLPGFTADGHLTRQTTDFVTPQELNNIHRNGTRETRAQIQGHIDELNAVSDPRIQSTIIDRAIESLCVAPGSRQMYEQLLFNQRGQQLAVRLPSGETAIVPVGPSWPVEKVKALLEQKFNLAANEHKLFDGSRELRNERTLQAELVSGQPLAMRRTNSYELFVQGPSKQTSISISPNADVSELRSRAQKITGMSNGSLNWNGKPLSDGRKLSDYNIPSHSRVACTPRLNGG